ncbi:MAG: transposase [Desulfobacteraceae bacterium]|nr:transposase [Desulfobacteraceae bacterium]
MELIIKILKPDYNSRGCQTTCKEYQEQVSIFIVGGIKGKILGPPMAVIEKKMEEPLTDKLKKLVTTLELIRIEEMVRVPKYWKGQSPKYKKQIARAFIAKAIYNIDTTRALIDRLKISPSLRRIYGWQKACDVPHESSFSRTFKEFSKSGLTQIVQASVIKKHMGDKITGHISNKVRLCERSEPQSEPFVGQARSPYIENSFFGGRPFDQTDMGRARSFFLKIDL